MSGVKYPSGGEKPIPASKPVERLSARLGKAGKGQSFSSRLAWRDGAVGDAYGRLRKVTEGYESIFATV